MAEMIPKIRFRYSRIYDKRYRESPLIQDKLKKEGKVYPSDKKIRNYIKKIEQIWEKSEEKILKEMEKITSLKWQEKEIICYVIGAGSPFSDPLTVRIHESKNRFIDILIHELIHQILSQNSVKNRKWWKYVNARYTEETLSSKVHILVHTIYEIIYLKLFDKRRLSEDIKESQRPKAIDYRRASEIVQEEGAENIIKKFQEVIK